MIVTFGLLGGYLVVKYIVIGHEIYKVSTVCNLISFLASGGFCGSVRLGGLDMIDGWIADCVVVL